MNDDKRRILVKIIFDAIALLFFTSGIIATLLQFVSNHIITSPKTWYTINSLESIPYTSSSYPSEVYWHSNKYFSEIYVNSFVINLYIKNSSENELSLSNLKFDLKQYPCDFPIITIQGYVENNVFKVDVKNISDNEISYLDISLCDDENILYGLFNRDMNVIVQNLKGGEIRTIPFFSLEDISGEKINTWKLKPYVTVKDSNENILITRLTYVSLNEDEYSSYIEEEKKVLAYTIDPYLYDITPDVIIGNDEIMIHEINGFIPAHEQLQLQLLIVSQVPCAFDLQISYWLDNKEYSEDIMSYIIYNSDYQGDRYEYLKKYIEIQ